VLDIVKEKVNDTTFEVPDGYKNLMKNY